MLLANLSQIFLVDNNYKLKVDYYKDLNHTLVSLTDIELVFEKDSKRVKFKLDFYEEDVFTKTYLSQFEDGTPFRVIRHNGISKEMSMLIDNSKDSFTVGSINPDGYSVAFILTNKDDVRNINVIVKGVEEQLQKLVIGALIALQNNLFNNFYDISKRLIAIIRMNDKNIHQLENGSQIAEILKLNIQNYDEIERKVIDRF